MKIDICLPIYNETEILEKNLKILLDYLERKKFAFDWKIILLSNGSNEYFNQLCTLQSKKFEKVEAEIYSEKGKGIALINYGKKSVSDIICYMDIDLAVDLEDFEKLIEKISDSDLVIGSRMMHGSKRQRSFIREISSRIYLWLSQIILQHQQTDLQCGFKAIMTIKFREILPKLTEQGWFFDTELIYLAEKNNFKITAIPVNWSENKYQKRKSKIKVVSDGFIFFKKLLTLKFKHEKSVDNL